MSAILFDYPPQAAFGRPVPKAKIFQHGGTSAAVRKLFAAQVERIAWEYKLAPETVNLPATASVAEIQVFSVTLKAPEVSRDILHCIDRAIPFPIVFELQAAGKIRTVAAFKRPHATETGRWVTGEYFDGAWAAADTPRNRLPIALDLGGLYERVLQCLIALPPRPDESLTELVARAEAVRAKEREVAQCSVRLAAEKQFNRKVDIHARLRELQNELEQLRR